VCSWASWGEVVGFAMVRPEQARGDAAAEPGRGELAAINVHPAAWGTGAGTALLDAAERTLAQQGFPRAVLWVAAQNPRARRFYERQGWTHDGVDTVDEIGGPVPTTRYSKSLP
jgi:ribosomal protein S18 acetylase RimI-like enzyme